MDIDSYRQNLVDMMDSEYSRTFKIDVPEGDKDNLIKNILSNNKTNNSIEIKDIQENLVK